MGETAMGVCVNCGKPAKGYACEECIPRTEPGRAAARWTKERHEAAKVRAQAVPPGPWIREMYEDGESSEGPHGVHPGSPGEWVESDDVITKPTDEEPLGTRVADCATGAIAEFVRHSRDDVPDMLAKIEALTAERLGYRLAIVNACAAGEDAEDAGGLLSILRDLRTTVTP